MWLVFIIIQILIYPGCLFKKGETEYIFVAFRRFLALWQVCQKRLMLHPTYFDFDTSNFNLKPEWLTLLNQKPPFFPPKRAKTRHQSLSLKKWPPMSFLIHFYCIFMWQFFLYQLKTAKNILILILFHDFSFKKLKIPQNLPAPKNFSRHTKVPNRHQPAK